MTFLLTIPLKPYNKSRRGIGAAVGGIALRTFKKKSSGDVFYNMRAKDPGNRHGKLLP